MNNKGFTLIELIVTLAILGVDNALRWLIDQEQPISFDAVESIVITNQFIPEAREIVIDEVDLSLYDNLLETVEEN